ncbi:hypothetical protein DDP54_11210 [Cellulomonas sp. WB94]|uniref:hypothetical protein n=1 Tax=Cellulomonas sp. WB94 TaxID=2173174 RepID=UPI000D581E82|nr:hypothetical protein [Cellulomonas sp. WB94]PVU83470.1 hypothetical protein DDP54_11210 [Cellulomonas sp. WB94]
MTVPTEPTTPIASNEPSPASTAAPAATAPVVPRVIDDTPLIPDRSADDSDTGWHEGADSNDERLLRDVPPHW